MTAHPQHPDDHIDHSKWITFFNDHIVFFSKATIEQCLADLKQELTDRNAALLENDEGDLSGETVTRDNLLMENENDSC